MNKRILVIIFLFVGLLLSLLNNVYATSFDTNIITFGYDGNDLTNWNQTAGWSVMNSVDAQISTKSPYDISNGGDEIFDFYPTTTTTGEIWYEAAISGLDASIDSNSVIIEASAYMHTYTSADAAALEVRFYNSGGTLISGGYQVSYSANSVWMQKSIVVNVPVNTRKIRIVLKGSTVSNGYVDFDGISAVLKTNPVSLSNVGPTLLHTGTVVNATSNQTGALYLVPKAVYGYQAALDAVVSKKMVSCSAGVSTTIPTTGLSEGTYQVYAVDGSGNLSTPSADIAIDNTAPILSGVTPTLLKAGTTISVTCNENGYLYLVPKGTYADKAALDAVPVANRKLITTTATVAANMPTTSLAEGTYQIYALDCAINLSAPSADITIDNTAPALSVSAPSVTSTASSIVTYTITYTGADYVTLTSGNITLNKTGTASGSVAVSGTGTTSRTVTISGISGYGTLGISIAAGTASDYAGNSAAAAGPSTTFAVDNTAPTLTISAPSVTSTASADVTYTITYTGADHITLASGDITLNKTGTASGSVAVSGTGTTSRTVTISGITGDGTLGISLAAGTASDEAGNTSAAAGPSTFFAVDTTPPTITIIKPSLGFSVNINTGSTIIANVSDSGSGVNATTVRVLIDGTAITGTASLIGGKLYFLITQSLTKGDHSLVIKIKDKAGNEATSAAVSFIWDNYRKGFGFGKLRFE